EHEAHEQRNHGGDDEPTEGLGEYPADAPGVTHMGDSNYQCREDEGPDEHLDQSQEDIRHDRDIPRDLRSGLLVGITDEDHVSSHDAKYHRDQDVNRHWNFFLHAGSPWDQIAIERVSGLTIESAVESAGPDRRTRRSRSNPRKS